MNSVIDVLAHIPCPVYERCSHAHQRSVWRTLADVAKRKREIKNMSMGVKGDIVLFDQAKHAISVTMLISQSMCMRNTHASNVPVWMRLRRQETEGRRIKRMNCVNSPFFIKIPLTLPSCWLLVMRDFIVPSPGYRLCSARACPLILHCRHTEYSHVYVPMWYASVPVTKLPLTPLIQTDESPPLQGSTRVGELWTGQSDYGRE